ncbi:MAG: bifunctional phosphoglucose/phosphomannose isomerase [Candidatus Omnitrophica bacterium]|nr:bifunctional phosphoglucose/phosphomannose isomerase [Candidatus Omnitrophota bacterium]
MKNQLDLAETRTQFDPGRILETAEGFLEQCRSADRLAREFPLPRCETIENVVICSMGGSAIGGDLMRAYAASQSPAPIEIVRNYTPPAYVNSKSLVIAGSYSGNTEETLSCYQQAKSRGAQLMAITTGGRLAELCRQDQVPCLIIPGGLPPRSALGYSFMSLLAFFEQWGLIGSQAADIRDMYSTLEDCIEQCQFEAPYDANPAKRLAAALYNAIPVIYSGQDAFEPISARWRAQLNENTKSFAHNFVVPEMNHNEILGWTHPAEAVEKLKPIFLIDRGYHKQTTKRFQIMKAIFESAGNSIIEIPSQGESLLARMMSLVSLGDFASIYLAYLYHQDPGPIPEIDRLKEELAR